MPLSILKEIFLFTLKIILNCFQTINLSTSQQHISMFYFPRKWPVKYLYEKYLDMKIKWNIYFDFTGKTWCGSLTKVWDLHFIKKAVFRTYKISFFHIFFTFFNSLMHCRKFLLLFLFYSIQGILTQFQLYQF